MANIRQVLLKAIKDSGETRYRICQETGLNSPALSRFISGERPDVRLCTVQTLADYFGLELRPKTRGRK